MANPTAFKVAPCPSCGETSVVYDARDVFMSEEWDKHDPLMLRCASRSPLIRCARCGFGIAGGQNDDGRSMLARWNEAASGGHVS